MTDDFLSYGKVILFGEHAAVYDRQALALGLAGGMKLVSCKPSEKGVRVVVKTWLLDENDRSDNAMGGFLRLMDRLVPGNRVGADIELKSSLPSASGLGSSAAMSVAVARTLAEVRSSLLEDEAVRAISHEAERIFHGEPSGLDDTVATYGGLVLFRRPGFSGSKAPPPDSVMLTPQARRLSCTVPPLVIGRTGMSRSTGEMVAKVAMRREEDRVGVETAFSQIEDCLHTGLGALTGRDMELLGAALSLNHSALRWLGVSSPEIEEMVGLAGRAGALGTKLTGAGGGGCVIALAPGREEDVLEMWAAHGFKGWVAGGRGRA